MKIPLVYGALMALAGALLTLGMFFAGLHETPERLKAGQWVGTIGGITIGVITLALAMRQKRAQVPLTEKWGYGSALGVGVLTGLVGALLGAIFAYIYFSFIHPDMSKVIVEGQLAAMEAKGASATEMERAEPMMRKLMSPAVMSVFQAFFGFIWSVALSLIIAIFMRRRPEPGFQTSDLSSEIGNK